ncbi:PA14 domain-containing protein [Pendulispora brunnea]|uniref:PA14 domain-containing protein n=1 Tax=Pendulispora brunnea TaxID=2905690 RepID=A0ABZ2K8S4_9BACT
MDIFRKWGFGLLFGAILSSACSDASTSRQHGAPSELRGTLEVVHYDDFQNRRSGEQYFIVTPQGRIRLHLPRTSEGEAWTSGVPVTVRGAWSGDQQFTVTELDAQHRVTTRSLAAEPVHRSRKTAVLLANFSNNPSDQPVSPAAAKSGFFTGADSANAFWKEASFNYDELIGKVDPSGDVYGYYTLDVPNTDCGANYASWGDKAMAQAQSAGVDLSGYDHISFVFAAECGAAWGEVGGQKTWLFASWYLPASYHELGHNFGLNHASAYACTNDAGQWVSISNRCEHGGEWEYGDAFDIMGGPGHLPSVWSKARLGYLRSAAITTVDQSGTFTLSPSFETNGTQSLRILKEVSGGVAWYYYLEYRRPYGRWDNYAATDPVVNGVTIRLAQDHLQGNEKPRLIDATPTTQTSEGKRNFADATLAAGQTFDDPLSGIRITVDGLSASGAQVRIAVDSSADPPSNGTGLRGQYYDNADLTSLKVTRFDPTIDFDWTGRSPDASIAPTTYSVRWQGQLLAQATGKHTFYTTASDGVRLRVDGQLLIDDWVVQGTTTKSAEVLLSKGQRYAIELEYFQDQAAAVAKLEWALPSAARTVVPASQLFPAGDVMFSSGFEVADTQPTWADTVDWSSNVTHAESSIREETAQSGVRALMYSGNDESASTSYTYNKVFDVSIPVFTNTALSYDIFPQQKNGTFVAIDLIFTDGSSLRDSGAVDQFGVQLHPTAQGRGGHLAVNAWTHLQSTIGAVAAGKTIDRILVAYDQPESTGAFRGYIDNVVVR